MTLDEALAHAADVIVPRLLAQGQYGSTEAMAVLVAAVRAAMPAREAPIAKGSGERPTTPRPSFPEPLARPDTEPIVPAARRGLSTGDVPPAPSKKRRH